MKEEGTVCWVAPSSKRCLAHSASDSAPILWALGAEVDLVSADGERRIPIGDLYRDDGIEYLGKSRDEILTRITLPASAAADHCQSSFWKLRRRGSIDFGVLSVAVAMWTDAHGAVESARIVLGAVASLPRSAQAAAESLIGRPLDEDSIAEAARLARKAATPFDNTDYQAQWRSSMVELYTAAALREAAGLDPRLPAPRIPTT
jgi:CO/xanthine dehydrogenase FAD-binding subunit